jgi:uncharacterized membrane protein YsdA (DUF1294 family)
MENYNILSYQESLISLLKLANKFSFVIRNMDRITKNEEKYLRIFEDFLLYKEISAEWPGTLLYKNVAHVFFYSFNEMTCNIILQESNSFFDWIHPYKPEDLCFYCDDKPIFASISHEKDYFFV